MTATAPAIQVDPDSPLTPADLNSAEKSRLHLVRPESVIMLHQMPDGRFFIHGPAAATCARCGSVFIGSVGEIRTIKQRHLALVHNESHPMLPR